MYSSDDDSPAQQQSNAGSNQAVFGAAQAGFGAAPAGFDTADNASVDSADLNNNTVPSVAVIGTSITIRGDVSSAESLVVLGIIEGSLDMREHDLIVGESGQVLANVAAREIRVEGLVNGDLFGTQKVTVAKDGHVAGNIVSPRVTLEDGAVFKGSIDMSPAQQTSLAFDQADSVVSGSLESSVASTVADATQYADAHDPAGVAQHYANQASPAPSYESHSAPAPMLEEAAANYDPDGPSTAEEAKQALQEVRRQFATD